MSTKRKTFVLFSVSPLSTRCAPNVRSKASALASARRSVWGNRWPRRSLVLEHSRGLAARTQSRRLAAVAPVGLVAARLRRRRRSRPSRRAATAADFCRIGSDAVDTAFVVDARALSSSMVTTRRATNSLPAPRDRDLGYVAPRVPVRVRLSASRPRKPLRVLSRDERAVRREQARERDASDVAAASSSTPRRRERMAGIAVNCAARFCCSVVSAMGALRVRPRLHARRAADFPGSSRP